MRHIVLAAAVLIFVVMASGCTGGPNGNWEERKLNENTTYVYDNKTDANGNDTGKIEISGDFAFMVYGETEFWLKPNDTVSFNVVFSNLDDFEGNHTYIAKVFPSAANFDAMAAFQCLHFTTCDSLLSRMRLMLDQPETPIEVNYTRVGLYQIGIRIPDGTPAATYMYNIVACEDLAFSACTETTTNFGPNIALIVHVIEA
jgi:hypothetical protein